MHHVLSYSLWLGCMVFNNLIWDQGLTLVIGEWYDLMTHSRSLLLHYYFMVKQSRAEQNRVVMAGWYRMIGWHDDGLASGILPSWEGVSKLATKAKFHLRTTHMMEMIISLDSLFREVHFWYKDHLIMTSRNENLNLLFLMHKSSRSTSVKCRLMKPNGCVSSPLVLCMNRRGLFLIWTHH